MDPPPDISDVRPAMVDVYETALYGSDVEALVAFYTQIVGLPLVQADPGLMAVLRLGGGGVLLLFDPVAAAAPGRFVPSHGTTGAGHVAFRVADLDAWRRHLAGHAVKIEREIDWGSERFSIYVRDPAGNSVEFVRGELWGSTGVSDENAPGDHRGFVGPADQYDVIGGAQFALLYALGLRERHRLLDIGCGSLRAGRMLIAYLAPDRYTGVEPNHWLVDAAIRAELGNDLIAIKRPRFDPSRDFSLDHLGRFDFVLAQGVATNTGPALLRRLLNAITRTLSPTGLAAVTFIHPGSGDGEAIEISLDDRDAAEWRYPGCYAYGRAEIASAIAAAGLVGQPIAWFHPRHQWWLLRQPGSTPPPERFLARLGGASLATGLEASWSNSCPTDV